MSEPLEPGRADPQTVSIVRLDGDQWVAVNTDEPSITHHATSLTDLLFAHGHAVAFRLGAAPTIRYLLGDDATADRIDRIRAAGARIAALRREAHHAEDRIRADRVALMRKLADLRVTPGEIAQIVGVPTTAIPKDLGTDRDARLARALLAGTQPPDQPEWLF